MTRRNGKKPIHLLGIERRFIPFSDIGFGPLAGKKRLSRLFIMLCTALAFFGIYTSAGSTEALLSVQTGLKLIATALCLRLILVDLRHLLLPDIYTLPLIVLGWVYSIGFIGHAWWAPIAFSIIALISLVILSAFIETITNGKSFLGGGDIKMIAAIAAWEPTGTMPLIVTLACFCTFLVLPFLKNKQNIPFGPGLCLALLIHLINPTWWHFIL